MTGPEQATQSDNLAALERMQQLAQEDGLTPLEQVAVYRLAQDMLGVKMQSADDDLRPYRRLPRWAPLASVALSAVAFVVSLVAVFS